MKGGKCSLMEDTVTTRAGTSATMTRSTLTRDLSSPTAAALYATPSYSALYTEPEDPEPGPGSYDPPSSLGTQMDSMKQTLPALSLTAKHESAWAKVMITKDHLNAIKCRDGPGAGTYNPAMVPTQARVRVGTSKRRPLSDTGFRAPGPIYEIRTGPDVVDHKIKFGKDSRFKGEGDALGSSLGSTGPGQYETTTAFDGARLAKSFGVGHKAYVKVRFPGSERLNVGKNSPGPGAYQSYRSDSAHYAFGRAERLPGNKMAGRSPGPGAYDNHERPSEHAKVTRNQSCFSFGRPHAKGRLDWKQMRYTMSTKWGIQ